MVCVALLLPDAELWVVFGLLIVIIAERVRGDSVVY